jgi:sugar/nucleoside kinase (ribokinase family)
MALLVVGSIAFDSIRTPDGAVDDALGGSASFFAYVASFFTRPRLVGVVGEDFPDEHRRLFADRGIDTAGLVTRPGQTFRWKGRYHQDMNTRDTIEVHLNVFGTFEPELPDAFRNSTHVFLANSSPSVQARVLGQVRSPQVVFADTMDLWIETQRKDLLALLPRLDGLLLNDSEARLLTGESNLVRAGHAVRRLGPRFVILKKGEHGAMLFSEEGVFVAPAYPSEDVVDPTGAGDSFAGGVLGYLASEGTGPAAGEAGSSSAEPASPAGEAGSSSAERASLAGRLRRGMAYGTVIASFTVEGFGLGRLRRTDRRAVESRLEAYRKMVAF